MSNAIPRPEYPRPQFVRKDWLCLNGEWEFEIDSGDSGLERGLLNRELKDRITVPFCPESSLSGVHNTDFLRVVWYRRTVTIPKDWANKRVLLHFQAVDYDTTVWVDGKEAGRHRGGFSPFAIDLGKGVSAGDTIAIVVRARDDSIIPKPRGKQCQAYAPVGGEYTRTTGIWQTVWLEPVPVVAALRRTRITPDVANGLFRLEQPITQNIPGFSLRATLSNTSGVVSMATCRADIDLAPRLDLPIPEECRHLWSPADPYLYGLTIELLDKQGEVVDSISSYAGLRSVAIDGIKVKINGEVIFQRLVLDQGYYPDGVMTAPTDAALANDIQLSMDAGFNGARLHQKVFEERFLYHADRLGYLVWGEFADWGGVNGHTITITYATQWLEVLERDYSHPAIIGWCPLNETLETIGDGISQLTDGTRALFLAAKAMDTSRLVLDASGHGHRVPEIDVYDSHDYILENDFFAAIEAHRAEYVGLKDGVARTNALDSGPLSIPYRGQPYFVSEFGGIHSTVSDTRNVLYGSESWGYCHPDSEEDLHRRFEAYCHIYLDNPYIFGYCYTQLTDIFPEENGIYSFDRKPKFDIPRVKAIQQRIAGIENPE